MNIKLLLATGISAGLLSGCVNSITSPLSPEAPQTTTTPSTQHPTPKPATRQTTPKKVPYAQASVEKKNRFYETMIAVANSTKQDPNYHRMALDTPQKKAWFKNLMYRLWDGQITKSQFIAEGVAKYPTHHYEFEFVANGFEKRK